MQMKVMQALIKSRRALAQKQEERYKRFMRWLHSDFFEADLNEAGEDATMETNYAYAFLDSMVAGIVPTNPQSTVTAAVGDLEEAARVRSAVIDVIFKQIEATRLLWRAGQITGVRGISFFEATWNDDSQKPEYMVLGPQHVWHDMTAPSWSKIRYLIRVTPMYRSQFDKLVKSGKYDKRGAAVAGDKTYPSWLLPADKDEVDPAISQMEWVTVYNVYDYVEKKYYQVVEDAEFPLYEGPLPYQELGGKHHFPLVFNDALDALAGISDIKLIEKLQIMLNELDTVSMQHAQASVPVPVIDATAVNDPDEFRREYGEATSPRDVILVHLRQGKTIQDAVGHTPTPQLSYDFDKAREKVQSTIEFLLALPQYRRGVIGSADIATEVALADEALKTRNGRRYVAVNSALKWIGRSAVTLMAFRLPEDVPRYVRSRDGEVIQVTGPLLGQYSMAEDEDMFFYDVVPYSPPEDSNAVKLRNLERTLPFATQAPEVKRAELFRQAFDLLGFDSSRLVKTEDEIAQEQQAAAAAMQADNGGGGAVVGPDGQDHTVDAMMGANQQRNPDEGAAMVGAMPGGEVIGAPTGNIVPPNAAGGPGV